MKTGSKKPSQGLACVLFPLYHTAFGEHLEMSSCQAWWYKPAIATTWKYETG